MSGVNANGSLNWSGNETAFDPNAWQIPLGAAIFLITETILTSTWSTFANMLVIVSFLRDPKLRLSQNYYIVSLATSDLVMGALVLPLGLYAFLYNESWPSPNRALCRFWNFVDCICSFQSTLSVCLISYDRYKMVLHPIRYRNEETQRRVLTRIFCTWVFSIIFYGPVQFWDDFVGYSTTEPGQCEGEFRNVIWLTTIQSMVEFGGPLVVMSYCNISLLRHIRERRRNMMEMRRRLHRPRVADATSNGNTTEPRKQFIATVERDVRRSSSFIMQPGQLQEQQKFTVEMRKIKKEQKAMKSLLLLIVWFFTLWFWYEIIGNFVMPICGSCVPDGLYVASFWPQYHISAINPLIYAITIKRFRHHLLASFACLLPCCIRPPGQLTFITQKNRVLPIPRITVDHAMFQAHHRAPVI